MQQLWLALDESNHSRYPEIIAGVYSIRRDDRKETIHTALDRMPRRDLEDFLRGIGRYFLVMKLEKGEIEKNKNQLVVAAPKFIREYAANFPREEFLLEGVLLDGEVTQADCQSLNEKLKNIARITVPDSCVYAFPKGPVKEGTGRVYKYPLLLSAADSLAHTTFREPKFPERIARTERWIYL